MATGSLEAGWATFVGRSRQRFLAIDKLIDIIELLKICEFPITKWPQLGLRLGLRKSTLETIEKDNRTTSDCLTECLSCWLRRVDNVDRRGGASLKSLSYALKSMNEMAVANNLANRKPNFLSMCIFDNYRDQLSQSLCDPVCVARMLHQEVVIKKEALNSIESASPPSVSNKREILLHTIREEIQTNHSSLQTFASVLCKFNSNVKLGNAINGDYAIEFLDDSQVTWESDIETASSGPSDVTPNTPSAHEVLIPVPRSLSPQFNSVRASFSKMFSKVQKVVTKAKPPLNELKIFLETYDSDLEAQLKEIDSMHAVFRLIRKNCSLIDVIILEAVVDHFEINGAQEYIEEYKKLVEESCESFSIDLCCNERFEAIETSPLLKCETATFIFDWEPEEHKLNDIRDILSKTTGKLVKIKYINKGNSITVTCFYSLSFTGVVVMKTIENLDVLIQNGLMKVTIGYCTVWKKQELQQLQKKKIGSIQDSHKVKSHVKAEKKPNEIQPRPGLLVHYSEVSIKSIVLKKRKKMSKYMDMKLKRLKTELYHLSLKSEIILKMHMEKEDLLIKIQVLVQMSCATQSLRAIIRTNELIKQIIEVEKERLSRSTCMVAVAETKLADFRLKDELDKRGLIIQDLNSHQCSENVLVRLSKNLDNWEVVSFYLGLTAPEVRAIKADNSEEKRRLEALNKWKEKKGDDATYYNLIEALEDCDRVDMIDQALYFLKNFLSEKEEQQKEIEKQKEWEMKENFYQKTKSQLLAKGLVVADLQVNIREEDVDAIVELIGKDWYTFGKYMKVEESTLDHIKEVGGNKLGRKKKLLEYFISKKLRYEDIIYGLYNSSDEHNPSINGVLNYLLARRESEDPKSDERQISKYRRQRSKLHQQEDVPWQAIFEKRQLKPPTKRRGHLTPETYEDHFFEMLWLEENEHIKKLKEKCDGANYKLTIYDRQNVPPYLLQNPRSRSHYGYISDKEFTDDKIEYATQASDSVTIVGRDGNFVAYKHSYNFNHLENCMYIIAHDTPEFLQTLRRGSKVEEGREINVRTEFEVKHSYFDHLQHAVAIVPDCIKRCLLPNAMSFSSLSFTFGLQYSRSSFMKLDTNNQLRALKMITSDLSEPLPSACPPPVILYGPYGSGKTRILARAAFEIMVNGVVSKKATKILICAHHEQSIETFIFSYFGPIAKKQHLPFSVILIGRNENKGIYSNMYMSMDCFIKVESLNIKRLRHVLIIATYTMSLRLHKYLKSADGFFTHILLDEAAQVREPEAITPLALATRNAKIVLAGDDRQVGPNILVLGEEARKFGLHISLLERLMKRYEEIGPAASSYVTKLSVNYRSHQSLMALPKLFYDNLELNTESTSNERSGPTGYSFVCSDSKLVPTYIDRDHPFVEACIVLEEVRTYLKVLEQMKINLHPRQICIITSTRKQLNHIIDMAYQYKEYEAIRKVSFKPSFMIQGHEFQAIFLSLFEPIQNDESNAFYVKSLFNPFVFNTVITRAKFRVVAIGKLNEVQQFENDTLSHPCRGVNTIKCWHEYLSLCRRQGTLHNEKESIDEVNPTEATCEPRELPRVKLQDISVSKKEKETVTDGAKKLTLEESYKPAKNAHETEVTQLKEELNRLKEEMRKMKHKADEESTKKNVQQATEKLPVDKDGFSEIKSNRRRGSKKSSSSLAAHPKK